MSELHKGAAQGRGCLTASASVGGGYDLLSMASALDIDAVEIRGGPLVLASDAEVDEMEARLGVQFPVGYHEYVTRLGEGSLNVFIRVLPPWRVLAELDEHRGMMAAYWFWDSGKVPFGQEQAMESIQVADTMDGDLIVFHPAESGQLIVLPRNDDRLYARGPDLLETINWVCSGGPIRRFGPHRYFEPFDSRVAQGLPDESVNGQPEGAVWPEGGSVRPWGDGLPLLRQPPRAVLLAYFAELRAVEEWGTTMAGGPEAFQRDDPPDLDGLEQLGTLSDEVRARYCTPKLAQGLQGASVTLSSTPEHASDAIRILDEKEERGGRVVIRVAVGREFAFENRYTLEQSAGEWRIASHRELGLRET